MITNNDFNQILQLMKNSGNPQQLICNMVEERMNSNPFFANLIALAKGGRGKEIETIARNLMKEKGLDFDKEFNNFRLKSGL